MGVECVQGEQPCPHWVKVVAEKSRLHRRVAQNISASQLCFTSTLLPTLPCHILTNTSIAACVSSATRPGQRSLQQEAGLHLSLSVSENFLHTYSTGKRPTNMFVFKRGTSDILSATSSWVAATDARNKPSYATLTTDALSIDGRKERVQFDKITARVSRLCYGLDPEHVDAAAITQKVISGVYQGVTTVELDNLVRQFYFHRPSMLTHPRPPRLQHI